MTTPDGSLGHLTPERFTRTTSATHERVYPAPVQHLGLTTGDLGFQVFVQRQLATCREKLIAVDEFEATAVLANGTLERYFVGEGDEYPPDFAARLRREAKTMDAYWSFVAMMAPAATPGHDIPVIDPGDLAAIDAALDRGDLSVGLCWTARATGGQRVGGVIYVDEHGTPIHEIREDDTDIDVDDPIGDLLP